MSRLRKFAHSLLSGYALLVANAVYTLASVPLALHYLSIEEFGLWALVMQMANFNVILIDLGMSGSLSRILVDHKDDKHTSTYGAVVKTGVLVLAVQAILIATVGAVISLWLPEWMNVPEKFWRIFRILMIWQCVVLAVAFVGRIFVFILSAHQRFDVSNYAGISGLVASFIVLWISFAWGLGLYSLLTSYVALTILSTIYSARAVRRLGFLPGRGHWGRVSFPVFRELFAFGTDLFLINIGQQLIVACQVPVVSRALGLEAAAVWSVAIKVFVLAQQLVYRIFDFSTAALAEMIVRGERDRLKQRFRDLMVLTGSAAAAGGVALALCNQGFLELWTHGKISWPPLNDMLMAVSFLVYASTRLHIGLSGQTKQIGGIKYIYFLEGAAFVGLGLLLAPRLGFPGIILSGIVTDLLFSGLYGAHRTVAYFNLRVFNLIREGLMRPLLLFAVAGAVALTLWWAVRPWSAPVRLGVSVGLFGPVGLWLFWVLGLPPHLQQEIRIRCKRFWPARAMPLSDRDASTEA